MSGFTPYSTLQPLTNITVIAAAAKPTWVPDEIDQERILSYQMYEQIFWNVPDTFKMVARSTEASPTYIPSARTIIDTINRYTAPGFTFRVEAIPELPAGDAVASTGSADDPVLCRRHFEDFFTREKFFSKFAGNKRYGLIRGDWLWHLLADPLKEKGKQISIEPLDPASYFPIWDPANLDRILGCHIVDTFTDTDKKVKIKRLTYRKSETPGGFITSEEAVFALDDWEGPEAKPAYVIKPLVTLTGISNLPVYHIKNFDEPGNPFGSSDLRGLERVIAAVNQSISDEELALAMEGLGFYWTDAPNPTNDNGDEEDWVIGPGRMVKVPEGKKINRVGGVSSVTPYLDHVKYLQGQAHEAAGTPDAAIGRVSVSVEVSGVALFLQLAPLIAKTDEKDVGIIETHAQMFYDLAHEWFPLYDGVTFNGLRVIPMVGEKLPVDRKAVLDELTFLAEKNIASAAYIRQEMARRLGYVFPEGMGLDVIQERAALAEAEDPFGARIQPGADGTVDGGTANPTTQL